MKLGEYVNEGAIVVMRWNDAAAADLRHWSTNGGDEDWIAVLCKEKYPHENTFPLWMDEGTPFGVCSVDVHDADSHWVVIGSHA